MRKLFSLLCIVAATCVHDALPTGTPLTNPSINGSTGSIVSGATLTNAGTLTGTGTFNYSLGTLTLANDQVTWLWVNKTGSSLADLATRSASDLTSGTLPDARFPATLPAAIAANLTAIPAANISGVIPVANLATGTPDGTKFLRDDGTLAVPAGAGDAVTSGTLAQFAATTSLQFAGVISDETGTGAVVLGTSPIFTTDITAPKIIFTGSVTETYGTGSPESAVTAAVGSTFHRTDGGTATTLYIKESGTGNTGWVAAGAGAGASGSITSSGYTMSTGTLLGRTTASTGAIEEITVGSGLSLSAGALTATAGSGSGDVVGPSSAVDSRIASFDTTTGKLLKDGGKTIADINPIGAQTIYIPAAALTPAYTNGCTTLKLVAGASGQPDLQYVEFDPSTEQYAQFNVAMPKSWNDSTVVVQFIWSHPSTTTNFGTVWGAQGVAVSDGDTLIVSYGTAQTVTDTGGTTDTQYITAASSAITIAGTPAAGDTVYFRIYRKAADASDTMTVVARLYGIKVIYTTSSPNDT